MTRDELPGFFKRIEYIDANRDGKLDSVKMKIYEEGSGWRDVGITRGNKYGIEYAEGVYKELSEKIKRARAEEKAAK